MRAWYAAVIEPLRLAVAVLVYMRIAPWLAPFFTDVPIVGETIAALAAASIVLVASWLLLPVGRAVVEVTRYSNGVPLTGPAIDLEARSDTTAAAVYGLRVRYEHLGLLGRWIARKIAKRGVAVSFTINSDLVVLHSESEGADEETLDRGVVLTLGTVLPQTTWQYAKVSVDTREMPSELEVDVDTQLLYPTGRPWYSFFMWSSSNVKKINLVKSKGQP